VTVQEQDVVIPTYLAGAPEKSPMFFFGRQSQGAEGRIYPYPLYDRLTGEKAEKTYKLVSNSRPLGGHSSPLAHFNSVRAIGRILYVEERQDGSSAPPWASLK
ncbi:MAG: hypothetical protein ACP5E5_15605, partial [Acidobacteriaceae bacterium]